MGEISREHLELSDRTENLKKVYDQEEITMLAEGLASYLAQMSDRLATDHKLEPGEKEKVLVIESSLEPMLSLLEQSHAEEIQDVIDWILKEDEKSK